MFNDNSEEAKLLAFQLEVLNARLMQNSAF